MGRTVARPNLLRGVADVYAADDESIFQVVHGGGSDVLVSVRRWDAYGPNSDRPTLVIEVSNLDVDTVVLVQGHDVVARSLDGVKPATKFDAGS